jgi:hypothetical protein
MSNTDAAAIALVDRLIAAKAAEAEATKNRVAIEQEIIAILGAKEEGAETHDLSNGFKVTITGKLTYSVAPDDLDAFIAKCEKAGFDALIKHTVALDETKAKKIRATDPKAWRCIGGMITTKAAKTAVSIKA